ncbi:MAG: DUF4340 domain-containing protein, partial [Candidatus Riflebacteria bacterium]|nr:DUF4340 domain-containing protein [Candidatus Riflebacteria bacterium]
MKNLFPTLVALLILGGLGFYVYKYERVPMADLAVPIVASSDRAAIAHITLEDLEKKTKLVMEKGKDSKWELTAPLKARPEDEKLDSLLNRLEKVKGDRLVEDVVPGKKVDLAQYGLDKPLFKVTWKDGAEQTLFIGKDS